MIKTLSVTVFFVFFLISSTANANRELPVEPTTIPEYDEVAGVIMYWSPYGSFRYDEIAIQIIDGIQSQAKVYLQTNDENHKDVIINALRNYDVPLENIVFLDVYGDRIWIRDHGPFSIYDDGELAFLGFNDFANHHGDKDLPERLAEYWDLDFYDFMHIIFDGGNYMVDSHNQLYATDRLYTNNPDVPEEEIDSILYHYMNIEEIYTFNTLTDDYWGHLDMQIKLLNDTTFIISTVDEYHPDYEILEANYDSLAALQHPEGKEYEIHQIKKAENWKTYINSLIVNDVVLVPIYDHETDIPAIETYEAILPEKTIIGINADNMIQWGGAIHCVTNQIPQFQKGGDYETFIVEFEIEDEDGNPLKNASITFNDVTNDPGDYVFEDIQEGTYEYKVEKNGYISDEGLVFVNRVDGDVIVDVTMSFEKYMVTFDIYLDDDPVNDAVVTLDGVENPPGDYEFEDIIIGTYDYKVEIEEVDPVEDQVTVENDTTVTVELYSLTKFNVVFDVVDQDGNEITGAVITFDGDQKDPGDYVIENVEEGDYEYKVQKEGYFAVEDEIYVDDDITLEVEMEADDTYVDMITDAELSVYPNPANQKFNIESNEIIKQIKLINTNGLVMINKPVNSSNYQVNISNLSVGIYFLQIQFADNVITKRVQIVR